MAGDVVLTEVEEGVGVVTLNRPEARNALNGQLLAALRAAMGAMDGDDAVAVVVVTGSDPAFCAGLDLKEMGAGGAQPVADPGRAGPGPWTRLSKPVIGAINGPAVTGGFEIALQCDFLVASERARFADTHTRVGLLPGWGMSVLLPQAVGVRKAIELSLTGNFLDADEAHRLHLVNEVVPHEQLMPTARRLAREIAANDERAVRALLAGYRDVTTATVAEGLRIESERAREWNSDRDAIDDVARRRDAIMQRGRQQIQP